MHRDRRKEGGQTNTVVQISQRGSVFLLCLSKIWQCEHSASSAEENMPLIAQILTFHYDVTGENETLRGG